jgi:hypothetical protein
MLIFGSQTELLDNALVLEKSIGMKNQNLE